MLQVVIIVDDKIVGCALSIIVDYNMVKGDHTYAQVTGNETFNTHNAKGNILYGIEVFIHPDYRGLRLARRMYEYRKELCEKLNLKAIMFGGRIPNYHKYADKMRPKEYIERVRSREIYDPVLTFQLSNDFHVRRVMRNYLPNDEESKHCATLLQWDNIYYQPPTDSYVDKRPTVRIGLVQWQMRPYNSLDDLFEQVEFFVDSVSDYKSDFILFPEYFNDSFIGNITFGVENATREQYLERVAAIRRIIPDCGLTTDLFVGYHDETPEDHAETLSLVRECMFDSAFMFKYSERPGTYAAKHLPDNVPEEVKIERLNELIRLQTEVSAEQYRKDVGKTFEVLVEGYSKRSRQQLMGRTEQNKAVVFDKNNHHIGDRVMVKITGSTSATLLGEPID
jgi:GNAT superfamily N-acetyltransferase